MVRTAVLARVTMNLGKCMMVAPLQMLLVSVCWFGRSTTYAKSSNCLNQSRNWGYRDAREIWCAAGRVIAFRMVITPQKKLV